MSKMLARLLTRSLHLRSLALTLASPSASSHHPLTPSQLPPPPTFLPRFSRSLSTHHGRGGDNDSGSWKFTPGTDDTESPFGEEEGTLSGITETPAAGPELIGGGGSEDLWTQSEEKDVFEDVDKGFGLTKGGGVNEWKTAEGYTPWSLGDEKVDVFDGVDGEGIEGLGGCEIDEAAAKAKADEAAAKADEEKKHLEWKEKELLAKVKGPERAFGDLIEMSGITDDMICSLILHKDFRNVRGLRPLHEIEVNAIQRQNETSTRGEIERKKQEEIAQARVRQVDEKGRAYGTGRRKCSIARVWIQCGDGKFSVNDKPFDSYFPILDHRAQLLHPFILTNTLGLWDITCTVKGGGVSGQVGAIRLGISRALQNWEPGLRQYLKPAGYLTRDPRVVERKKPGKAKARKSFQWVKR